MDLIAAVEENRLLLRFTYRPDLFDRGSVEVLGARLLRLLELAAATPERPIGSLDVLSAAERRRILEEWNDTTRPLVPATLPDLFVAQAERTPDAIAVVFEGKSLSYGALNRAANQVAHRLRKCGVGPESVVGLCLNRSLEMIVGLLGILKAGAAYLPLDPDYPAERLSFMLSDSRTCLLVTSSALRRQFDGHEVPILCLDAEQAALTVEPAHAPIVALNPQHPAYVIYTSGSTGRPKGVVTTHCNIVGFIRDQVYISWSAEEVVMQIAPLAFDASDIRDFGHAAAWRHASAYAARSLEHNRFAATLKSIRRHSAASDGGFVQHADTGGFYRAVWSEAASHRRRCRVAGAGA